MGHLIEVSLHKKSYVCTTIQVCQLLQLLLMTMKCSYSYSTTAIICSTAMCAHFQVPAAFHRKHNCLPQVPTQLRIQSRLTTVHHLNMRSIAWKLKNSLGVLITNHAMLFVCALILRLNKMSVRDTYQLRGIPCPGAVTMGVVLVPYTGILCMTLISAVLLQGIPCPGSTNGMMWHAVCPYTGIRHQSNQSKVECWTGDPQKNPDLVSNPLYFRLTPPSSKHLTPSLHCSHERNALPRQNFTIIGYVCLATLCYFWHRYVPLDKTQCTILSTSHANLVLLWQRKFLYCSLSTKHDSTQCFLLSIKCFVVCVTRNFSHKVSVQSDNTECLWFGQPLMILGKEHRTIQPTT